MATQDQKADTETRELNSQALALAEQLGRIAGALEGTAEVWLNRASVTDQLTKVRDGATQLLNSLAGAAVGPCRGKLRQSRIARRAGRQAPRRILPTPAGSGTARQPRRCAAPRN